MIHDPNTDVVLREVRRERARQNEKWGLMQELPSFLVTSREFRERWSLPSADEVKASVDAQDEEGLSNHADILLEEVMEAFSEDDPKKLREELVQVAAVAVKWVERLDMQQ